MARRFVNLSFLIIVFFFSACSLQSSKELPDVSKMADEAGAKIDQVKSDVLETKEKVQEKAEDIQNAVKAVDKVFGEEE